MASIATSGSTATATDVELLSDEGGGLLWEEGITTATFFKGDFASASTSLRSQFSKTLAVNPWLAGRLVVCSIKKKVVLRHPSNPTESDIDKLFNSAPTPTSPVSADKPYTELCTSMFKEKKYVVTRGDRLIGKDTPVTLLSIVKGSELDTYTVIFSMSHAIGDGRTYYEILKMLSPKNNKPVRPLTVDRIQTFSETMRESCGKKEFKWADSPAVMIMYELHNARLCGPGVKCVGYYLDEGRVEEMKKEKEDDVDYLTTNDILTSKFFTVTKSRIGMMGMDCRGKLAGFGDDLAGNYVTALSMDDTTFGTPSAVHRMLAAKSPYTTTNKPLPSFCGWLVGKDSANFAMVTNWSSFAGDLLEFEGGELELHIPIKNPAYCTYDLMIPFAAGRGRKGVICWIVGTNEEELEKALPLGDFINKAMFP